MAAMSGSKKEKKYLKDLRFPSAKKEDRWAKYKQMSEEEFEKHALEATLPLRTYLFGLIEAHEKAVKKQADEDATTKRYLEIFEPMRFQTMYPDHVPTKRDKPVSMASFAKEVQEQKAKEKQEEDPYSAEKRLEKVLNSQWAKDMDSVRESAEAIKKAVEHLTGKHLTGKDKFAAAGCA